MKRHDLPKPAKAAKPARLRWVLALVLLGLLVWSGANLRALLQTAPAESDPEDVIGGDWRVWGLDQDGGTIVRDGTATDVRVCVHRQDAIFYYDTEVQSIYDCVLYPAPLQGEPTEMYQSISFDDLDGDGNSDVELHFAENGTEIRLVWLWDAKSESYEFQLDRSENAGTSL